MFWVTLFLFALVSSSVGLKTVTTSYGKVRGITEWSDDTNHKYTFKSIPFAKPPVGDLRFALPQDPDPWDHVLDASKYSNACACNNTKSNFARPTSEDCLYINIFTSEQCFTKGCAVIIYYHGGGFKVDSAVMFPDNFILERYVAEDVIFVTPAYRLGAFGQLYFGPNGVLSENLLVFDALKAIHFVHNEIKNFGGDPNRVTLMGHSAGGTLIDALGFSRLVDSDASLFQQMITFSGQGEYGFYDVAVDISYQLAEKVGCITTDQNQNRTSIDIHNLMKCLRKLDSMAIISAQTDIIAENEINFKSIIRGAPFMELNGLIADNQKTAPKRNMICGTTQLEYKERPYEFGAAGTFMDFENPHEVVNQYYKSMKGHERNWTDPLSSAVFISARTSCEAVTLAGGNAFLFESNQKPNSSHKSDMQYFIGIHREGIHTPDMDIVDSFYSKMLVNFTKTGVPSPVWEKLDVEKMNYLEMKYDSELNEGPVMREGYHDKETAFWFGPVTEYDKNVTKMKQESQINNSKSSSTIQVSNTYTTKESSKAEWSTNKHMELSTTLPVPSIVSSTSSTIFSLLKSDNSIFQQWWFWLIVALVVMILILICISICRSKSEEETPLLN